MLHELLIMIGGFVANEIVSRVRYGKQLQRGTVELVKRLPKGTAQEIATQVIIEANQREMEKTLRRIDEIKANASREWREAVDKAEADAAAKRQNGR
jgi:hypothetical protein